MSEVKREHDAKRPRTQYHQKPANSRVQIMDLLATVGDRASPKGDASFVFEATCVQIRNVSDSLISRMTKNADAAAAAAAAAADAAGGDAAPPPMPPSKKDDRETFDAVGNALMRCGTELPFKAGIYATVAALICASPEAGHSARLAAALGVAVSSELVHGVREGRAPLARRSLRYLAELAKASVVSEKALVDVVTALLEAAVTELSQTARGANNVHARGEFLADVALSALPFCGKYLQKTCPEELERICELVRAVIDAWLPNRWRAVAVGHAGLASEAFGELTSALLDLMETQDWEVAEEVLPQYCVRFADDIETAPKVEVEKFVLPKHSKLTRYTPPRFRLCLLSSPEVRHVRDEDGGEEEGEAAGDAEMVETGAKAENEGIKDEGENGAAGEEGGTGDAVEKDEDAVMKSSDEKKEDADAGAGESDTAGKGGDADMKEEEKEKSDVPEKVEDKVVENGDESKDVEMKSNGVSKKANAARKQSPVDRYVLRQYVVDVLDNFVSRHSMGADRLLAMPMLFGKNDVIVETLFSEMCATPTPTNPSIYYGSLFVDLCKVKDSRLPIKLLAAVEKMFLDSGSLEEEAFDRLTAWFSFHLSNFGFKWNWADWAVYADTDMVEKFPFRALFCRDVLDRMVRLSYRDRIVKIVPEDMLYFLPPAIGTGNPVRFNKEISEQLTRIVAGAGKQPAPIVKERLDLLFPSSAFDGDEKQANLTRLVALIRALLQGASRTLSHFDTLIERYRDLLVEMSVSGGVAARKAVALEAGVFWSSSDLRRLYVLDKLSNHRIIDGLAILDYLFTDTGVDESGETVSHSPPDLCKRLEQSGIWELARLVFSRARSRLEGARAELALASSLAVNVTEGDVERAEERIKAAKAGAQHDKTMLSQLVLLALRRLFMLSDIVLRHMETVEEGRGVGEVFTWRALGMMLEIGRKHPDHVEGVLDEVRDETASFREQHISLQNAFDALEEIAGCDIAC